MSEKSDVILFAESHTDDTELLENGKLRFCLTGMEFSPTTPRSLLEAYANGRAMKRAKNQDHDYSCYLPHIVAHKLKDPSYFLYCRLTNTTIPKIPEKVQGHVNGRRFRAKLADWHAREKRREGRLKPNFRKHAKEPQDNGEGSIQPLKSENGVDVLDAIDLTDDSVSDEGSSDHALSEDGQPDDVPEQKIETAAASDSEDEMELEGATQGLANEDAIKVGRRSQVRKGGQVSKKSRTTSPNGDSPRTSTGKRKRSGGKVPKKLAQRRQRFRLRTTPAKA